MTEKLVTKALSDLAAGGSCSRSSASAGLLNTPATAVFATSPFSALKPMFPSPLRPLTSNSTRNTESVHTVCSTPSLPSTLSSSLPSTLSTTLSSTLSSARSSLHLSDPQRLHQPEAAHSKSAFSALGGGGGASSTNQGRGAKRSACDSSGEEDSGRDVSEDELHDSAQVLVVKCPLSLSLSLSLSLGGILRGCGCWCGCDVWVHTHTHTHTYTHTYIHREMP